MTNTIETHPDYRTGTWKLDPTHSELSFSVKHLKISKVKGTFETWDVTVVTGENPNDTTIEATVDVASVNTKQADRDNHLRTSDFFLVEAHPNMTFKSTSIALKGDDLTIEGDLTLRGVTLPVTLKGEFGGVITDDYGRTKAGAAVSTVINRQEFGVSWNAALEAGGFTLGDDVTITIDLQVDLQP
ncbi:MAG: polyisoprenoid-binding protein [Microbacteriaceae bacterium]|nr:polyisoprenoid-binding protein [Microbacteriaceae bacterium]